MTSYNDSLIYAAVTDHNSDTFGQGNSGIAIVARQQIKREENQPTSVKLAQIDAVRTTTSATGLARAALLNNESNALHIGNSTISILNNAVDLNWYSNIRCLYTALTINAQGSPAQGGQAIVVGMWAQDTIKTADDKNFVRSAFLLRSITFPSVFAPGVNNIVGSIGDNVTIAIHQTRPLLTTTVLNYLVILGGVGTQDQTRRSVYALPLVKRADLFNGMLAKKDAVPHTFYHEGSEVRIAERGFIDLATKPGDLFTADDKAVQVGHGPMGKAILHLSWLTMMRSMLL